MHERNISEAAIFLQWKRTAGHEVDFAIKIGVNTILHKMKGLQTLLRSVTTNQS